MTEFRIASTSASVRTGESGTAPEGSRSGNSHWMKSWFRSSAASFMASTSNRVRPRASGPSPSRKAVIALPPDMRVRVLGGLVPVQNHLAGLTRAHGLEAFLEALVAHLVGDQRGQVQTGLQQAQHLAPGREHLAAVDALDGQGLEDDRAPVGFHRFRRNTQHGHAAAHDQGVDALTEGYGRTRHLERNVETDLQAQLVHDVAEVFLRRVHGAHARRDLLGQLEAEVVDVGQDDRAGAGVAGDGCGHHADGTRAGDQHVLPQQIELLRRVNGVAERIEDRADLVGHVVGQLDHVEGGSHDVFCEGALPVHADAAGVRVEVEVTGAGRFRVQIDDVALGGNALADLQAAVDVLADGDDLAGQLVARDHGNGNVLLGPLVPVPDVDVGAADGGALDPDQHVLVACDGDGRVDQLQADARLHLGQCLHGIRHQITPNSRPAVVNAATV